MGSSIFHQLTRLLKGEVHDCHCYHRNQSGKNVFAVHGVGAPGKSVLLRPSVPRAELLELIAALPPCRIGMEACSGAHHWARELQRFDHSVRLMAPKFVAPCRLSGNRGKNEAADAAAICEPVKGIKTRVLLGHGDVSTTMIYTHVLKVAAGGIACPLDLTKNASSAYPTSASSYQ